MCKDTYPDSKVRSDTTRESNLSAVTEDGAKKVTVKLERFYY